MQRRHPRLGPQPNQHKYESGQHPLGIQPFCHLHQHCPVQSLWVVAKDEAAGKIDEDDPQQREGQPDTAHDQVFPGCLQRGFPVVQADQERGDDCGQFDTDPHQADAVDYADGNH